MPGFKEITKNKKSGIINNFEEVEYFTHDTVIEYENNPVNYVYWIFSGEVLVYKKMDVQIVTKIMNDEDVKEEVMSLVGVPSLQLFHNPPSNPSLGHIGVCIGSFKGEDFLIGEDSALFKKELGYSMVAKKGLVAFRYPAQSA